AEPVGQHDLCEVALVGIHEGALGRMQRHHEQTELHRCLLTWQVQGKGIYHMAPGEEPDRHDRHADRRKTPGSAAARGPRAEPVEGNGVRVTNEVTMEVEGQERPALVAEIMSVRYA